MAPAVRQHPGTRPTEERVTTVDEIRISPAASPREEDTIEAQYAGLERLEETPHGCYEGWVYMGFEGEDLDGEHVEEIEAMRQERGLSRQGLAQEAGIAVETVVRVERGHRVRRKTGWKVAQVFGVHPREIGRPAG
jgi:DNA-binding XRE family transcriptional regulator